MTAFPKPAPKFKEPARRLGARSEPRRGPRRDPAYRARVRRLKCAARLMSPCQGRVECDHMGPRGLGQKCHDDEGGPMCQGHHRDRTDYAGVFEKFLGADMRRWCDRVIEETRKLLGWTPP